MATFKVNGNISATGTMSASSFLGNASSATYTYQWRTTAENPCTASTDSNTGVFNVPDSRIYWISKTGTVIDQLGQWGYILDIGNNAERHQIWMTQSSGDMAHRGGNSNGWSGSWRVLLDSVNYTSYTVTKTGTGASGTWGINITGSAAYATSAGNCDTVDGWHANGFLQKHGWWNSSGSYSVDNLTSGIVFAYTNHGAPASWGHTIAFTSGGSDSYVCQLHATGTNRLFMRNKSSDYGQYGWIEFLTESNYSSYALPKSGGTINGNLTIGYSLGISQENGGGNGISLYGGTGYVQSYGLYFAQTKNFGGHGAVTGDWATYFSMDGSVDRGWIFRHANGNKVASISASGIISGAAFTNGSNYHLHPGGGIYVCSTPSITGYLKITLPVGWTNTMFRFDINIYDYTDQNTVTYTVGGYNYQPSAAWYNYSAESRGHGDKANLPVSFGYDGSRCAVYIGWWNTSWSYPQVSISNVLTGYSNYSATWSGNWGISFSSSNNGTSQVIYNPNSSARTVNYGSSLPSDGYHAGAIFYKT